MEATEAKRRKHSIPPALRKEVVEHIRSIACRYRAAFAADPKLKLRVVTLTRALLPPRPRRRGRPRNPMVTRALALYARLRRRFPDQTPRQIWNQVYPLVIPEYVGMSETEQVTAREELRERIKWLRRKRRKVAHKCG
jgi:hypothetical protein